MTAPENVSLWWGYGLHDIDRLARTAAARATGGNVLDPGDRYTAAWDAVVDALSTAEAAPGRRDVLRAAVRGVNDAGNRARSHRGIARAADGRDGGTAEFCRYWALAHLTGSPEDWVVDRAALRQIWPQLSTRHQHVLYALALADGDHRAAAASLGLRLGTYRAYLADARAAYRVWWHEHETPSAMWGRSGTKGTATAARTLTARLRARERRAVA